MSVFETFFCTVFPTSVNERLEVARKAAANDATLKSEDVSIVFDGSDLKGKIFFCEASDGKPDQRPLVMVVHNYAGRKQFDDDQGAFLARCGYTSLVVDMYPESESPLEMRVKKPDASEAEVMEHYRVTFASMNKILRNHKNFRALLQAWLDAGLKHPSADPTKRAAAIGYCFGGMAMFEMVRCGMPVDAVVSFHGLLQSDPVRAPFMTEFDGSVVEAENTYANKKTVVLVEHGTEDPYVPPEAREKWFAEMNGAKINWVWHEYSRTAHGFALAPDICTEYEEDSDRRSTIAMLAIFKELWPDVTQKFVPLNACGTPL